MLAAAPASAAGSPTVAAILAPGERSRVDAAGTGCFAILHRDSISDAIRMVRERPVDAVLLSVQQCGPEQVDGVAHLIREFPSVPTVALVSQYGPRATETLLLLGASGVKRVIDVTAPTGWAHLRELLTQPVTRSVARIQGPVIAALTHVTPDTRLFLEAMIRLAPDTPTVRNLAKRLGVRPSTLMSRFARPTCPARRAYLAAIRLLPRRAISEDSGLSIADVATASSILAQSFGRHVRSLLGITSTEFRHRFPFPVAVERFVTLLIAPYAVIWERFHPLQRTGTTHVVRV